MELGWPVGQVLGSEAELLERYEVSRAVFREAVRIVEQLQVARTRRGPGGGLVITEPTVSAVIDAVVLYLHRVDAPLNELFEARIVLEEIASQLAAERSDENDIARLRIFLGAEEINTEDDPRALHALVASASRNPGARIVRRGAQPNRPTLFIGLADSRNESWEGNAARSLPHRRSGHRRRFRVGPAPHAQAPRCRGGIPEQAPINPAIPARSSRSSTPRTTGRAPRRSPAISPSPSSDRAWNQVIW